MAKEEKIKPDEIDASFVISSFKNKERRNNPDSEPKPLVPEHENQKKNPPQESDKTELVKNKSSREPRKQKRDKLPDYEALFIREAGITARTGKSVYIRKDHHEKIMKIVQVIGKNQLSLFSYIDNVLNHHFESFKNEITELYYKNNEGIF